MMGALDPSEPRTGEVLARKYELRSVIGRGGFGVVYEALHLGINRKIALKVLLPEFMDKDSDLAIRFRREALLASELRHPNTITLYDYGQNEGGILYMAMEFVEGRTLANVLRDEAPIPAYRVVHIARQILGSLHEAHQRGIIHRDLKPGNIMLTRLRGDPDFVKVLDFGIAKAISSDLLSQPEMGQTLTQEGRFCGTQRYMAPEQFRNAPISTSVDLYSLGLICYELLTGLPAVTGETMVDLIVAQVTAADLTIPAHIEMPDHQREALHRALRKNPAERFENAVAFLAALDEPSTKDSLPDLDFLTDDNDDFTVEFPPDADALARLINAARPTDQAATNPSVKARQTPSKTIPTPAVRHAPPSSARPLTPPGRDKRTEKDIPAVSPRPSGPNRGQTPSGPVPPARRSIEMDNLAPLGAGNGKAVSIVRPSSRSVEPVARMRSNSDAFSRPLLEEEFDTTPIPMSARPSLLDEPTGEATHPQPRRGSSGAPVLTPSVASEPNDPVPAVQRAAPPPPSSARPTGAAPPAPRRPFAPDDANADATIEVRSSPAYSSSTNFSDDSEATIDIAASDMLSQQLKDDYNQHIERQRDDDEPPRPRRPPARGPSANPSAFYEGIDEDGPTTRVSEEKAQAAIRLAQRSVHTHRLAAVPGQAAAGAATRRFPWIAVAVAAVVALVLSAGCVVGVMMGWGDLLGTAPTKGGPRPASSNGTDKAAAEFVTIDIRTTPRNATLLIDQADKGITPKTITCRRDQKVLVTLKKEGYLTRTDQIVCATDGIRTYTLSRPGGPTP